MRSTSVLMVLSGVAGCAPRPSASVPPPPAPAGPSSAIVYTCPDGYRFSAKVRRDSAEVGLPSGTRTLPLVPSASGARFAAGDLVFWSKDELARMEMAETTHADCRGQAVTSPWEQARLLGAEFRAVGQEPGWELEVDEGRWLRFVGDYGAIRLAAPAPAPRRDTLTGVVTYAIQADGHELVTSVGEATCRDAMSGEAFSHEVRLRLDGRDLAGCGRTLGTTDVTGIYWKLLEVEGVPAIGSTGKREAHLRLTEDGFAAGFTGCNSFRGKVERSGTQVKFGPLATTRMACLNPDLAGQERRMLRGLQSADRVALAGEQLTLHAGPRPLARFGIVYLR